MNMKGALNTVCGTVGGASFCVLIAVAILSSANGSDYKPIPDWIFVGSFGICGAGIGGIIGYFLSGK